MPLKPITAVAAALALVLSGTALAAHRQHRSQHHRASRGAIVELHKTKLGKVLATSSGRTLYMYKPDAKNKSNCYAGCASFWPPLISKGKARAGKGLKAKLIGVAMRKDGKHQVTYKGHPLYRFAQDSKAGQVNGEGYQGIWFALNARGAKVAKQAGGSNPPPTTTTGGGGGYGY